MKKSDLTSLLTAATLFLSFGLLTAAAGESNEPTAQDGLRSERRAQLMKHADLNGDGVLDEVERMALENKRREKLSQNPRFLKRADTDQDGQISDAEWAAVKEKMKKKVQARKQDLSQRGERGPRPESNRHADKDRREFQHGYLLGKYDANVDRKLDEEERVAMRADREARFREHMQTMLTRLNAVDSDGDGQISDAEWSVAKDEFKKNHPGFRPGPRPGKS